ncbi:MAG: hypothetical protein SOZ58_11270 [Prevotella sp.]|nr:hypothetical protein [Prevotella sp.]
MAYNPYITLVRKDRKGQSRVSVLTLSRTMGITDGSSPVMATCRISADPSPLINTDAVALIK